MKHLYYDLHTHSCLSPCGDDTCTPASLAGWGKLGGLDVMALTDHNTCGNCPAFFRAAQAYGILPIGGMELTTAEDIHAVCLFPTLESAMEFDLFVKERRLTLPNKPEIFGNQLYMDEEDNVIGTEPYTLPFATSLRIDEVVQAVKPYGGAAWPAHIDRTSNGILAVLGDFPTDNGFTVAEVRDGDKEAALREQYPALRDMRFLTGSDAHRLEDLRQAQAYFEIPEDAESPEEILGYLFSRFRGEDGTA